MEKLTHNIVIQIIKRETVTKGLAFLADKTKSQLGERGHGQPISLMQDSTYRFHAFHHSRA